ncbi:MAG TPA: hypothetical protein VFA89_21590 [Terriglobales bacterium]|nr:hypothetical protein [Terriglobales bacterium]
MNRPSRLLTAAVVVAFAALCTVSAFAQARYVITNDDNSPNTATFYAIAPGGGLFTAKTISTGGQGLGGGFFATPRVNVVHSADGNCVYVSDAVSNDVAGININTLKKTGTFPAGPGDSGDLYGIGLAMNAFHLYAAYTASNTIATYGILPGCKLQYLSSITAVGLNGNPVDGISVYRNKIMVVAYGDGSIESFDISSGVPVSNNDLQFSSGYPNGNDPGGVDITQDGHYAIFGDIPTLVGFTTVEVSDISTGKLKPTTVYGGDGSLGTAINSNNVRLSPDEKWIYISNNSSGQVTAVGFNASTGAVTSTNCVSNTLSGYFFTWFYTSGLATAQATGNGKTIYVAEWGQPSSIGVVNVSVNSKGQCTLSESAKSYVNDANSQGLLSLGVYPPRAF